MKDTDIRPGTRAFYAAAVLAFAAAYGLVLSLTAYSNIIIWMLDLLANLMPLLIVAIPARLVVKRYTLALPTMLQMAAHAVSALVFAAVWFFLLMVFLGLLSGESFMTFSVQPFLGAAALWQMMQGMTFYALVALTAYVERLRASVPQAGESARSAESNPRSTLSSDRVFIRDGDEMRPLEASRIVCISAAGDYAEVVTRTGNHLLRTSLAELADSLGPAFLRIHRSTIVNIDHVERVEPAGGGRLSVHLANGSSVIASRAGARAIREKAL